MPTHLNPADYSATAGSLELISDIESVGPLDVNNVRTLRQHTDFGTRANNFNPTLITDNAPVPTEYRVAFVHAAGMPTSSWLFASQAVRDTQLGLIIAALTT